MRPHQHNTRRRRKAMSQICCKLGDIIFFQPSGVFCFAFLSLSLCGQESHAGTKCPLKAGLKTHSFVAAGAHIKILVCESAHFLEYNEGANHCVSKIGELSGPAHNYMHYIKLHTLTRPAHIHTNCIRYSFSLQYKGCVSLLPLAIMLIHCRLETIGEEECIARVE
jgi:ribosomal protein S8E